MFTVVTTSFVSLAEAQVRARHLPDLALVVVDHPVGGLTETELDNRVDQALAQMRNAFQSVAISGGG